MTIAEFLLARIASRQAVAEDMRHQALVGMPFIDVDKLAGGTGIRELIDPERVLAECEAKRRIVRELESDRARHSSESYWMVMRLLALPYADHPDYASEWRP